MHTSEPHVGVCEGVGLVEEKEGIEEFFIGATRTCAAAIPEDVAITFDLDDGTWTLSNLDGELTLSRRAHPRPDCRVSTTADTFRDLLDGRLHYRRAFFDGHVQVQGDVGLVINLLRAVVADS